jgi:hypothetical protein
MSGIGFSHETAVKPALSSKAPLTNQIKPFPERLLEGFAIILPLLLTRANRITS